MTRWQVQQAKSHFSELMDKAVTEGPQTITKHGAEVVVMMSTEEYRRLTGEKKSFIEHLLSGPKFDDFELPPRQVDPPRDLNLFDEDEAGPSENAA
ncbi:type II toxin-antitoxin system Phd/YefM family antitoxin [Devosia sp.]|uniref:type II toxin-antitoxin system Phd/YefM family antitoxin n=1 Tax=Devosia sp. TaxID=1871048 RepID=UPI003265D42A